LGRSATREKNASLYVNELDVISYSLISFEKEIATGSFEAQLTRKGSPSYESNSRWAIQ
jgi:hypothetical protein